MKNLVFAIVLFAVISGFGGTKAQAQGKIGYISMEELVGSMPEAKKADTTLGKYKEDLEKTQQDMQAELASEEQQFIADSAKYSQVTKDMKRRELQDLYQQVQTFPQDANNKFGLKQQEVYGPIQKKAIDAIQQVARENGYTYILTKENLIVSPPGDDILPLVKKKLGLQ